MYIFIHSNVIELIVARRKHGSSREEIIKVTFYTLYVPIYLYIIYRRLKCRPKTYYNLSLHKCYFLPFVFPLFSLCFFFHTVFNVIFLTCILRATLTSLYRNIFLLSITIILSYIIYYLLYMYTLLELNYNMFQYLNKSYNLLSVFSFA